MLQQNPGGFRGTRVNNTVSDRSALLRKKSVFDSIDANQIGEGKYFTEGKFGHKKNLGLKGQLSKIKRAGRLVTKNLSKKNLNDMYNIVSNHLKKHSRGYGVHINRRDKMGIMQKAEELVRTKGGNFSREDKADLEKIVDSLKQQSKNTILNKRRGVNSSEIKNNPLLRNKNGNIESGSLHLNNSIRSSNVIRSAYESKDSLDDKEGDEISELGDYKVISKPLERNDELGELEKKVKDLAI